MRKLQDLIGKEGLFYAAAGSWELGHSEENVSTDVALHPVSVLPVGEGEA